MNPPSLLSLALRNLFFTLLQPGIVAGVVPYWLASHHFRQGFAHPFQWNQYAGIVVFIGGVYIMSHCIIRFALDGFGTLSPADPTQRLVVRGLYRYSRNPMYVGVMLILIGEAIFCQSFSLWVYSAVIFTAFNLFIIFWEEPRLQKDFGEDYQQYCLRVRRWL